MRSEENKAYIRIGVTVVAVVVISLLCFFLLFRLSSIFEGIGAVTVILRPFLYGAVIAYILAPLCNRLEGLFTKWLSPLHPKKSVIAGLSIGISLILALTLVWILVMMVFPQVWDSLVGLVNAVPGELATANSRLHNLLESQPEIQAWFDEFSNQAMSELTQWLKTDPLSAVGRMISELGSRLTVFLSILKNLFLGILVSIYILASRKRFAAQGKLVLYGIFPRHWAEVIEEEIHYADRMFNGFLVGKLLDSAIIGVLCFIGTTLMGIKSAALVSVIVGVTNIIPFFGPFIGAIPCALLILLDSPLQCLYFVLFVVVLQQLDGNVIGPKILGNSTGLSSFWVILSILLFGGVWGITGMIVGVPLCAVLYDITRKLIHFGLNKHGRGELMTAYNQEFHAAPEAKPRKRFALKKPTARG